MSKQIDLHAQSPDETMQLARKFLSQYEMEFTSFAEALSLAGTQEENKYIYRVNETLEVYSASLYKIISQLKNLTTDQAIFLPIVKKLQDSENLMQSRASARTCTKLQMEQEQDALRMEEYYRMFFKLQKSLRTLANEIENACGALK